MRAPANAPVVHGDKEKPELTRQPRFIRCRCTPCTDTEVGAQRPHPLPRCVSECYTFSAPYTEVPTTCPHRHLGYSRDVHTGGAREFKVCTARRAKRNDIALMAPKKPSSTQNATLQSMGMDVIKQYTRAR